VDVLNSLIETEQRSIFRLMGDDSPYLREASPAVRRVLEEEKEASYRHADELARLVRQLGGQPIESARTARPPMLEFVSLRFLLPKLVEAKELLVRYYENALHALGSDDPEVERVLRRHLAEHQEHLAVLRDASAGK
jgi:bacterioferritin (cytochrome b1)